MPVGVAPLQKTPGGDFGWLKKDYTWPGRGGSTASELGETHGHNIVAIDAGYVVDNANSAAPGGSFVSANLGCTSCHDPHGRVRRDSTGAYKTGAALGQTADPIIASGSYSNSPTPVAGEAVGAYRLLRGLGDASVSGVTFTGVATAIAPSSYNRKENATTTRVAYGANSAGEWGEWCASCHTAMHSDTTNNVHPIDQGLGSAVAAIYNAYVKSGDMTGTSTTSYNSLVPFAENNATIATLQSHAKTDNSYMNGPLSGDKVMCLSCHRAHASGFEYGLRWNIEYEFMTQAGLYTSGSNAYLGRGRTEDELIAAYYDRPSTTFATYQRVLCNKCHAKD